MTGVKIPNSGDFYTLVMSKIGWNIQQFQFSENKSHNSSLKISKAVVELLLTLVGDEDSVLIDVVRKTLDALEKSGGKSLTLSELVR